MKPFNRTEVAIVVIQYVLTVLCAVKTTGNKKK